MEGHLRVAWLADPGKQEYVESCLFLCTQTRDAWVLQAHHRSRWLIQHLHYLDPCHVMCLTRGISVTVKRHHAVSV